MPKRFAEYTFRDHLHFRPLSHAWKTWKYRRMDDRYMALPAAGCDVADLHARIAGRNVLATIAFEDPEGLELHASLIRRNVRLDEHVIADNSRDADSLARNRAIADAHGALYLRLPENPWTARSDSRSHGISLNWLWHNLLKPGRPAAFGFVDDDLFPVEANDPFAPLARHPFCGDLRVAGPRWFLWPGYCFFRYDAVADKPLDFGLDWFIGLDTGGGNWDVLYRHVDPRLLPPRPIHQFAALEGVPVKEAYFERRGAWIHEVGWPAWHREAKRRALLKLLAAETAR
jgi:hypothetical protein